MPGGVMPTRAISSAARSSAAAREPPLWRVSTSAICEPMVKAGLRVVICSWEIIAIRFPRPRVHRLAAARSPAETMGLALLDRERSSAPRRGAAAETDLKPLDLQQRT